MVVVEWSKALLSLSLGSAVTQGKHQQAHVRESRAGGRHQLSGRVEMMICHLGCPR